MEHFGILRVLCKKESNGTFTYVGFGDSYLRLISSECAGVVNYAGGGKLTTSGVSSQLRTKNSKLDNRELNNIKKNSKKKVPEAEKLELEW